MPACCSPGSGDVIPGDTETHASILCPLHTLEVIDVLHLRHARAGPVRSSSGGHRGLERAGAGHEEEDQATEQHSQRERSEADGVAAESDEKSLGERGRKGDLCQTSQELGTRPADM